MTHERGPIEEDPVIREIIALDRIEEKLKRLIQELKTILSVEGKIDFGRFWGVRQYGVRLFKEKLHPSIRAQFWSEFQDLSSEAKACEQRLSDEADFTRQQIVLTIEALEKEMDRIEGGLCRIEFSLIPRFLEKKREVYERQEGEVRVLRKITSSIIELREELVRCPARYREKKEVFDQLSRLGDRAFGRRSESTKVLSENFMRDVEQFVAQGIACKTSAARQAIQDFQAFVKELSITPQSFEETRRLLSDTWLRLKEIEQEQRQASEEERKENESWQASLDAEIDNIIRSTRSVEDASLQLGLLEKKLMQRREMNGKQKLVKETFDRARQKLFVRLQKEEKDKSLDLARREKESLQSFERCRQAIIILLESDDQKEVGDQLAHFKKGLEQGTWIEEHREEVDYWLWKLEEHKSCLEEHLVNLSESGVLATLIDNKINRQKRLKKNLEKWRSQALVYGGDFDRALRYDRWIKEGKAELVKLQEALKPND